MSKVYLVTGANSGLGYDSTRKLALLPDTNIVYLACRNQQKADKAIQNLTAKCNIPAHKLRYVHFDATDTKQTMAETLTDSIDEPSIHGIILNAGGLGNDTTGKPQGSNKVVDMYQMNVIGNVQLVNLLVESNLLADGCRIVYSSSEAARGVPLMMIGQPHMGDTANWYKQRLTGQTKKSKFNPMAAYGKAKGTATLYWSAWARRHPQYHVLSVSPGGTDGTEAFGAEAMPGHFKAMMPVMMPLMKAMGKMHELDIGSQRYVDAVLGQGPMSKFASGTFVASKKGTSGEVVDQTALKVGRQYGDHRKQEAAFEALSSYVGASA